MSAELSRISRLILEPDYVLQIPLPMAFKQRPRLTKSGHAYMDTAYKNARKEFRDHLKAQWPRPMLEGPVGLYLRVQGEARGDADNLAGFFMDAAAPLKKQKEEGILWGDDRLGIIPLLVVDWVPTSLAESAWEARILELNGFKRE